MSPRLLFPDAQTAADVLTFAGRAGRIGDSGVRLQARGGSLAMTAAPLAPRGLLDATPTVLGMRVLPVDPELICDVVVAASALVAADERAVALPETGLAPAWAGVSPPRRGWEETGRVPASVVAARAQWGIAAVADALPTDAGDDAVRAVRAGVWSPADEALDALPLGTAFAAFSLGFIGGDETAIVRRSGAWRRLTLDRGHVLVRGPVATGLTAVRTTGAPG